MTAHSSGFNLDLPFYVSGPLPCPYLPDRVERKLFARLTSDKNLNAEINSTLTRAGFRRSHDIVYRPACDRCGACVPVRIAAHDFLPTRSLRRIRAINRNLIIRKTEPKGTDELYALFQQYQAVRHADSDMARMSRQEFDSMMREGDAKTRLYTLFDPVVLPDRPSIAGAMIIDQAQDGLSAVYSFFRTDQPHRSLGTYMILALVEEAQKLNLPYVYLGYWIKESRKMAYKARFPALQALGSEGWQPLKRFV